MALTLRDSLNLCYVRRWVIAPMHKEQSVAEHSYRVAVLVRMLHAIVGVFDLHVAVMMALDHDAVEALTGDIPGPHKDLVGDWPNPERMVNFQVAVKVADALESYDWWEKWGEKSWAHPYAPKRGDQNRDVLKIKWYCRGQPRLLNAVRLVMAEQLGYTSNHIESVLGGIEWPQGRVSSEQHEQG